MLGKPWTCAMTDAHLDEALMGELSPLLRSGFSAHRRACPRCNDTVTAAVGTVGMLRALPLEAPSPDFAARVVAARPAPEPAPRVPWLRAAQASVVWAVCCMVALISVAGILWPEMVAAPREYAMGAFGQVTHALHAIGVMGSATLGALGVAAWVGGTLGLVVFYAAAFVGLRTFLLRRST